MESWIAAKGWIEEKHDTVTLETDLIHGDKKHLIVQTSSSYLKLIRLIHSMIHRRNRRRNLLLMSLNSRCMNRRRWSRLLSKSVL